MPILPIVLQNAIVVKAEIGGHFPGVKHLDTFGVIGGGGRARRVGEEDDAESMFTRVAIGRRIDVKLFNQSNVELGFFARFAAGGGFDRFTIVHKTTRERPAERFIAPFNEDNGAMGAIAQFNNDIDGGSRVTVGHNRPTVNTATYRLTGGYSSLRGNPSSGSL